MPFYEPAHDPGGKKLLPMPAGMKGDAEFRGRRQEYRPVLRRWWNRRQRFEDNRFAMWIGMNPSTAIATMNDPTIARECFFTGKLDMTSYLKMNVMDLRFTKPEDLIGREPCSNDNHFLIKKYAAQASYVIAAWGGLPKKLQHYADAVEAILSSLDVEVWCLGTTKDYRPRHPLYVDGSTPFQKWVPKL